MSIDPRTFDPTEPIYQTPDRQVGEMGNIRRRERDVYFPPEEIQKARVDEYKRYMEDLRKSDPETYKEITRGKFKEDFKDILLGALKDAALDALFARLGGGAVRRGRLGKSYVENGGIPERDAQGGFRIERSECEICIIHTEDWFSALYRYREENPDSGDVRDIVIPLRETITCWRLDNPKCNPEIPEPEEVLPPTDTPDGEKPIVEFPPDVEELENSGVILEITTISSPIESDLGVVETIIATEPVRIVKDLVIDIDEIDTSNIFNPQKRFGIVKGRYYQIFGVNSNFYYGFYTVSNGVGGFYTSHPYLNVPAKYGYVLTPDFNDWQPQSLEISSSRLKLIDPVRKRKPVEQPTKRMKCNCNKIEADLKEIKKVLGIGKFPIESPRRLIQPRSKGQVKLKDLPQLFENLTRQIDRSVGFLPMTIEIKDSNQMQEGNQPIVIQVESIADGLREILQILCNDESTNDATQNIALRTLYEAGISHKLIAEMKYELDEIQEFLGYEIKEKNLEVPFAYNPLAKGLKEADKGTEEALGNVLPQILEQSKVKIRVAENVDKKTLYSMIQEVHANAVIAAAGVSERVGSRSALDTLMNGAQVAMDIAQLLQQRQILKILGGLSKTEFENLMNELELRYTKDKSPVPEDIGEPYQQDNQPKIKLVQLDPSRLTPPGVD